MMKKIFAVIFSLILLMVFIPIIIRAQQPELCTGTGYQWVKMQSPSFGILYNSYNQQYSTLIKKELQSEIPGSGNLNFNFRVNAIWGEETGVMFGADIGYSRISMENTVEFTNSDELRFDFRSSLATVGMHLGIAAGPLRFGGITGLIWMPGMLRVSSAYSDGTISYGVENILHGFYGTNRVGWFAGSLLSCRLGPFLMLDFTAKYMFKPSTGELSNTDTFNDHMDERNNHAFPEDIKLFVSNPYDTENILTHDLRGWMLALTIHFSIRQ